MSRPTASSPPPSPSGFALPLLFALAAACALALASIPRALVPEDMPALMLPAAEVADVLRSDAQRVAAAPKGVAATELTNLFTQFGASEIAALEDPQLLRLRRRLLHRAYERVVKEQGADAALAVRELALSRLEAALDLKLDAKEVKGVLGLFPNVLSQHRATRDGDEIAPHFVVRTLYKARWNRMLDLAPDFGFVRVERVAYFGWLGMHADNLPLAVRRQALLDYAAAGGPHASEALGVLAFVEQDYQSSVAALSRANSDTPSLRLRNYLRGAQLADRAASAQADDATDTREANLIRRSLAIP